MASSVVRVGGRPLALVLSLACVVSPALVACGGNPAQQMSDSTMRELATGHRAEVLTALAADAQVIATYTAETGGPPADQAAFAPIARGTTPNVRVTYARSAAGWCMVGTSVSSPPVTAVWTSAGQQPDGVTACP